MTRSEEINVDIENLRAINMYGLKNNDIGILQAELKGRTEREQEILGIIEEHRKKWNWSKPETKELTSKIKEKEKEGEK